MKNRIFDIKLFREGMRQTRVTGIVWIVILAALSVLPPVISAASRYLNGSIPASPTTINMYKSNIFLLFAIYFAAPLITIKQFGFLNRRKDSDFYHSLPQTRKCLYVSFSASAAVWVILGIAFSVLSNIIVIKAMPWLYLLNMSSVACYVLAAICGSMLVITIVLVAMSLTGTIFSNIAFSLILLFLPRTFITVMMNAVMGANTALVSGRGFEILDSSYNIPAGIIIKAFAVLFGSESGGLTAILSPVSSYASCVYTIILALAYFLAGMFLFGKRRSEAAGRSAVNKYLQAALRIAITMAICLFACAEVFYILKGSGRNYDDLLYAIVLYLIALGVYFLYELISTKKPKNLIKIFPGVGVLAALNIIVIAAMAGIYKYEINFVPDAYSIVSVSIVNTSSSSDYFKEQRENIEITDEDALNAVSEGLISSINGETAAIYQGTASYYTMLISTEGRERYRNVILTDEQYSIVIEGMSKSEDMSSLYLDLPEYNSSITNIELTYSQYYSDAEFDSGDLKELYETARKEIAAMSFGNAYRIITTGSISDDQTTAYSIDEPAYGDASVLSVDGLELTITQGVDIYTLSLPIVPLYMPESCLLLEEMMNTANADALSEAAEYLEYCLSQGEVVESIHDTDTDFYAAYSLYFSNRYLKEESLDLNDYDYDSMEKIGQLLNFLENYEPSGDEYIVMNYYYTCYDPSAEENTYIEKEYEYILRVDSSQLPDELIEAFTSSDEET